MTTRKKKAAGAVTRDKKQGKKVATIAASTREPEAKVVKKKQITLRLDADVIGYFRAMGTGYQPKMNSYLGAAKVDTRLRTASETPGMPWYEESRTHEAMANRIFRPRKEQLTLRVDADTVAYFRLRGKGYQSKMNRFLRLTMVEMMQSDEPKNDESSR